MPVDPQIQTLLDRAAGGNMAAVTALRVRDQGGPELCAQLLLYPVTDYHTPGTPSYAENAEGYGLTRDTMRWFWAHYLGDASEGVHPYAAPLRVKVRLVSTNPNGSATVSISGPTWNRPRTSDFTG